MASASELMLLGTAESPFVVRVRMALHMKGLPYEYLQQDLFDKSDLLVSSNPVHKKVPVLIHGGKPVLESLAIVQYIDEAWSGKAATILPADPYQRATARFWAAYADEKLYDAYVGINRAVTEEGRAAKVVETLAAVEQLEAAFAQSSNGKPFFAGNSVGFLDLAVGCHLFWLETMGKMSGVEFVDTGKTPLLAAWAKRFGETEPAKQAVPELDVVVEYAKKRRASRAAAAAAAAAAATAN